MRPRASLTRRSGARLSEIAVDALALGLRRTALRDEEMFDSIRTRFAGEPPAVDVDNLATPVKEPFETMANGSCRLPRPRFLPRQGGLYSRRGGASISFERWKALGLAMWVFSCGIAFDSAEERWQAAHRFADVLIDPSLAHRGSVRTPAHPATPNFSPMVALVEMGSGVAA